jgi:CDP-diacylglycerol--serine O-phosphatidyltransferase
VEPNQPISTGVPRPPRDLREHRRRRFRRHRRRAFIRSVYSLPSLATLGNALCGFAAMYIATGMEGSTDRLALWFAADQRRFVWAALLIFIAMLFDALDGRLARFTRHTTDFGGQLDSLADVVSFGVAPAFIALQLFKEQIGQMPPVYLTRLIWAAGAMYLACAAIRLARFNVSNKHGEQHHFSFLGLPSPGAAGAVAATLLLQQELHSSGLHKLDRVVLFVLPAVVLLTGLLMVSTIRYAHLVNRYLRGKRSVPKLLGLLALGLLFCVAPYYTLAAGMLAYAFSGLAGWLYLQFRHRTGHHPPARPAP